MKKKVKQYARQIEFSERNREYVLKDFSRLLDKQVSNNIHNPNFIHKYYTQLIFGVLVFEMQYYNILIFFCDNCRLKKPCYFCWNKRGILEAGCGILENSAMPLFSNLMH